MKTTEPAARARYRTRRLFVMVDAPDVVVEAIVRFASRQDSGAAILTARGERWENGA